MIREVKLSHPLALFTEALIFYRRHFKTVFYLLALPILLRVILEVVRFEGFKISLVVVSLVTVLINLLAQIAFILLIVDNGKSSVRSYLKQSWPIFLPFLWVTFLAGLASLAAAVLLIVPGIIVAIFLTFSSLLVVVENKRGVEALRASWRYVRGQWWAIFFRLLFLVFILLLALAVIYLISLPFSGSPFIRQLLSSVVSGLILSPVGTVYLFRLYRELKNEL